MTSQLEHKRIEDAKLFVRDIANKTQVWALVTVAGDKLKFSRKGREYEELLEHLGPDDMSFAYAKIIIGDDASRREKFILITWVGPQVSGIKKGRMMIPRAEIDKLFDQRAKVIEATDISELSIEKVRELLVIAGGADYGVSTS